MGDITLLIYMPEKTYYLIVIIPKPVNKCNNTTMLKIIGKMELGKLLQ